MTIDFSTKHGERALDELRTAEVVWMTTIGHVSQTPQPNLIWFLYQDGDVIIYTKPDAARLANIAANPHVSLNFDSSADGEEMTVFTGVAEIDDSIPPVIENPAYVEKYTRGIAFIGSTPQRMSDEYSVRIRVRLDKLRGW